MTAVVHLSILYQAVCHQCGWEDDLKHDVDIADNAAEEHVCEPAVQVVGDGW